MKYVTTTLALVLFCAVVGGCETTAPTASPVEIPAGSRLIALGRIDTIVLNAPHGGTLYFVDDRTGEVVYSLAYPAGEDPMRLAEAPAEFKSIFSPERMYRIYVSR